MNTVLSVWPARWTRQQRSSATIAAAAVVLVLFMWGVAKPLSWMPEPIGPVADEFASVSPTVTRVPLAPIRWLADLYVWVVRGTPLLVQILFVYFALPALVPGLQLSDFASVL